ncbi:MAG: hypothetical protein R3Y32_01085 [Bacillota bacterium]
MDMPYEYKKQYDATENFVVASKKKIHFHIALLLIVTMVMITFLTLMILYEGYYFLLFLFFLAWVYVCFSKVIILKKVAREPKFLLSQFDSYALAIDEFAMSCKYPVSDYFTSNLFEYFVTINKPATTDQICDELLKLKFQPLLDFNKSIADKNYDKESVLQMRREYLFK